MNRMLGGILLVAGTTIGAGMLALPVVTGFAGFFPSLLLFLFYWVFMTFTAFLFLEANLWMGEKANMISMAKKTLGRFGAGVCWVVYLFLLYALTTAYLAGGGPIILDLVQELLGFTLPDWVGIIPLLFIFGYFVYKGTHSVDFINRVLMSGLVIAYLAMVLFLAPYVQTSLLSHIDWAKWSLGVSIVATSFGFHIVIPSLVDYLDRDVKKLRTVLLIGSLIPLIVYTIWEYLTLGIIPVEGTDGIAQGYLQGMNGAHLLSLKLGHSSLALLASFFSFFAIITSFLGVSLSLQDFLIDGLKISPSKTGKILVSLLAFIPPLVCVLLDPRAFLSALEYAGAFGVVLLLGLIPALMVWRGRYMLHLPSAYQVKGGKLSLLLAIIISISIISFEIINKF